MSYSNPSIINPRWKRMIRVKYKIIRAGIAGLVVGGVLGFLLAAAIYGAHG